MQETLDVDALMKLAAQAARRNDPAEAAALLRRVLAIQEQALGPENAELAPSLSNLAMMLERLGENQEAERCYRRAYAVARGAVGPDDPLTQAARGNLVEFLHATGKLDPLRDDIGDEDAISTPTPAGPAADNVAPRLTLASAEPVPPPAPPPAAPRSPAPPSVPPPAAPRSLGPPSVPPPAPPPARAAAAPARKPAAPVPPPPPSAPAPPPRRSLTPLWVVAGLAVLGLIAWLVLGTSDRAPVTRSDEKPAVSSPAAAPAETPASRAPEATPPPASSPEPAAPVEKRPLPAPSGDASALTADASLCQRLNRGGGAWRCDPFPEDGQADGVYYYTRVKSPRDVVVRHRWTYEGTAVQTVSLQIRANARDGFRTFSHQRVAARPGQWEVALLAADGTVVDTRRFTVAR